MTAEAGTTTSTYLGSGGAGAMSGSVVGSGAGGSAGVAGLTLLSRPAGVDDDTGVEADGPDDAEADAGVRLGADAAGASCLAGTGRGVARAGSCFGDLSGSGAGSGASAGFAAGAAAGGLTTPSVSVTGCAAGAAGALGAAGAAAPSTAADRSAAF